MFAQGQKKKLNFYQKKIPLKIVKQPQKRATFVKGSPQKRKIYQRISKKARISSEVIKKSNLVKGLWRKRKFLRRLAEKANFIKESLRT